MLLAANAAVVNRPNDVERTIQLVSQHGSAKEVLLVAQESLDALLQSTKSHEEKEVPENETSAGDNTTQRPIPTCMVWKWIRIIEMYTSGTLTKSFFPRLAWINTRVLSLPAARSP